MDHESLCMENIVQEDIAMTPDELKRIGCQHITWNGGAFEEYYLPITGSGRGYNESRICVRFGEIRDVPYIVYLFLPGAGMMLDHINSATKFAQLYTLLTGKKVKG